MSIETWQKLDVRNIYTDNSGVMQLEILEEVVWRNVSILGHKLVLAYAEWFYIDWKIVLNANLDDASL